MSTPQLFVDSDEGEDDYEEIEEAEGDASGAKVNGVDVEVDATHEDAHGQLVKKRRLGKKKKKAKKLGPKGEKKDGEKLTAEEIKELTAKEYEHYSNLYTVQIQEVLEETTVSGKRRAEVQQWLEEFKTFVQEDIPKSEQFSVADYKQVLRPVKLPLPNCIAEGEAMKKLTEGQSLQWQAPWSVVIRGSWAAETALNKVSAVDVFLEMPYEYLVKSDVLNHKYHMKRAIYLAFIAKKLKERGDPVKFTLANGETLKPVLSLMVNDKVEVLIHAVPPQEYFKAHRLSCESNNLRFEHFFNEERSEDEPDSSTQHYNFTILEDGLATEIDTDVKKFLKSHPKFRDAIKLLKIWLAQRELSKGYGGFSGLIVTQFLKYLCSVGKVNENMTVFQIIRLFYINLVQTNLSENGISFSKDGESKRVAHLQWDIVLLDETGLLNFAANMSKYTYKRVQEEARRALTIIDAADVTGFLALFVTRVKFMLNFDHVIRLTQRSSLEEHFNKHGENKLFLLNYSGFLYPLVISTVGSLIETCLGHRITILDAQLPQTEQWEVTDQVAKNYPDVIRFGVNINREASQRIIEKCESNSHETIEQFKAFWGDKVELRRFKDGTLFESVPLENLLEGFGKSRICYQMLHYIFQTHLEYDLSPEEYIDRQVENLLESRYIKVIPAEEPTQYETVFLKGKKKQKKIKGSGEPTKEPVSVDDVSKLVSKSFDELSKHLRQLEKLPLQISTVQGTSAVLRFSHIQPTPPQSYFVAKDITACHPTKKSQAMLLDKAGKDAEKSNAETKSKKPKVVKLPRYVEPVGVIIHLETSGQWPDDMEAIERLKCAFLLKIGQLLRSNFSLTVHPYARYLDVLKDGFVFRIKLTYFRELTLLRELRGSDGILRVRDNPESLRLEKEALILPQLTSTLHSFHLQFEAFGKTCRLAKRWISSQLLMSSPMEFNRNLDDHDGRLSEEAIELLVASLFLNYAPHLSFPSEAHVGFQRFLYLLANTDFRAVPIVLNFSHKLSRREVSTIELEFVKLRPTLPALFISTPFDKRGSVWTRHLSEVILGRIRLLAKEALSVLEKHFESSTLSPCDQLMKVFHPSTKQFDVIIQLKNKMSPRYFQSVNLVSNPLNFNEYKKCPRELIPVTEFDPVQMYLRELRNTFGHLALFLHDLFGGKVIAVVWKPDVFKAVPFTSATVKGRQLSKGGDSVVTNVNGVLEAFELMGEGLVEQVDAQSDRWTFED